MRSNASSRCAECSVDDARAILLAQGGDDMARRRYQAKGRLYKEIRKDVTYWRFQYWEDVVQSDGRIVPKRRSERIGTATGPERMTEKQARAYAQDNILSRANANRHKPQYAATFEDFVRRRFIPEYLHKNKRRASTRKHYETRLENWILPSIGATPMRDIHPADISDLVYSIVDAGKSTQTATHVRNICSAVFKYAAQQGLYNGANPARLVESPEMVRKEVLAYSLDQSRKLLDAIALYEKPLYEMVFAALDTGLRVGELRGLRWFRVNLSPEWALSRGESLPPFAILIREQLPTNGKSTEHLPLKGRRSPRTVPLSRELVAMLTSLQKATEFNGPEHPVFSYGEGIPVNTHNVSHRVFRDLAKQLRMPVSWHVFRHTHATMLEQTGMSLADRKAQLGHGASAVTMDYTHSDLDRRRRALSEMSGRILANKGQTIQ